MTFSLPNSSDDIFTKGWLYKPNEDERDHRVTKPIQGTLWDALEQSNSCSYFKDIVVKAQAYDDLNNPNLVKTIFVPLNGIEVPLTPRDVYDVLTINVRLNLTPCGIPTNLKVQNNAKEYISISLHESRGIYLECFDKVWRVIVPNVPCTNGLIHIITTQEDYQKSPKIPNLLL